MQHQTSNTKTHIISAPTIIRNSNMFTHQNPTTNPNQSDTEDFKTAFENLVPPIVTNQGTDEAIPLDHQPIAEVPTNYFKPLAKPGSRNDFVYELNADNAYTLFSAEATEPSESGAKDEDRTDADSEVIVEDTPKPLNPENVLEKLARFLKGNQGSISGAIAIAGLALASQAGAVEFSHEAKNIHDVIKGPVAVVALTACGIIALVTSIAKQSPMPLALAAGVGLAGKFLIGWIATNFPVAGIGG